MKTLRVLKEQYETSLKDLSSRNEKLIQNNISLSAKKNQFQEQYSQLKNSYNILKKKYKSLSSEEKKIRSRLSGSVGDVFDKAMESMKDNTLDFSKFFQAVKLLVCNVSTDEEYPEPDSDFDFLSDDEKDQDDEEGQQEEEKSVNEAGAEIENPGSSAKASLFVVGMITSVGSTTSTPYVRHKGDIPVASSCGGISLIACTFSRYRGYYDNIRFWIYENDDDQEQQPARINSTGTSTSYNVSGGKWIKEDIPLPHKISIMHCFSFKAINGTGIIIVSLPKSSGSELEFLCYYDRTTKKCAKKQLDSIIDGTTRQKCCRGITTFFGTLSPVRKLT
ncbi:hypothetical protein C5167_039971 [Papaver somniferum]|uniref:Uncharacterized protein n=1 Tax=Papaver somniferum TaxID=3469 RepID=A0A4Y7IH22_PAPSO|nr:hypothetical protein C5167_039971 [Papaver somniferum]